QVVDAAGLFELDLGAGDHGRAVGGQLHAIHHVHDDLRIGVADVVVDLGEVRHHVRGLAAVGDDVVDARAVRDVFAQIVVGDVHDLDAVQRRAAGPRGARGVARLAVEAELAADVG